MVPMPSPLDIANQQQLRASNPKISTFVSASAGSGKTKLLTDRILRLLLTGTPARKILCLTYTKAAAAEMAIRLNNKLGSWVMMADDILSAELTRLDVPASIESRAIARQLLANILDLPGGMRISTIHAFCQSVLKRFPLEAEISPHFEVQDESDLESQLREAREVILADDKQVGSIFTISAETNESDFTKAVSEFSRDEELQFLLQNFSQGSIDIAQRRALGIAGLAESDLERAVLEIRKQPSLANCLQRILDLGNPSGKRWATDCLNWLALSDMAKVSQKQIWWNLHFTKTGRKSLKSFFGKNLAQDAEALTAEIDVERERLAQIAEAETAIRLANFNTSLFSLAGSINQIHQARKAEQSLLSYSDLISSTLNLLSSPAQVAWVLYKLDEGIDHLLLDEVQDTAPPQWKIIDAIAQEFFNGLGAREVERSIFAVGDPKQSIFSFQGSDLESFEIARAKFRDLAEASGRAWLDCDLSVSFRSTEPVLSLVDEVFSENGASHGVCSPGMLHHVVSRQGQAGRVTLWPMTGTVEASPPPDWDVPTEYVSTKSPKEMLANKIADYIKEQIESHRLMPSRRRSVTAGDFLILVRHRDELVLEITKACKARNIAIAGLDRMVLTAQQAVSDLLALCDSLLLPSDDLAFAQYLASPLGGLSDDSLMQLALGRAGSLSAALFARHSERDDWSHANEFFQSLRRQVDFISPFALLALALGPLRGRAKLLQRLGPEAAEPIDELMSEAQAYAQAHPASLQQFIFHLRQSGAAIKREPEGGGDVVRIMTVHGAKGLQAPIVILPDTTSLPKESDKLFWLDMAEMGERIPVYCPHKDLRSNAIKTALAEAKQAQLAEYNRLLYVALTRAEDELIICGAESKKKPPEFCWYNSVRQGFARLSFQQDEDGSLYFETAQTAPPDRVTKQREIFEAQLPGWAGAAPGWHATPPSVETMRVEPLAPSRSADEKEKGGMAASPLGGAVTSSGRASALAKGKIIHSLLQHLPALPEAEREAALRQYLAQTALDLDQGMRTAIEISVSALLQSEALKALFGPGSRAEIPLAGIVGDVEIGGLVDRLVVQDKTVILADFKTDRHPPASLADVPAAYLRQMAAYTAILKQIFPAKSIHCQLVWTETANIMALPNELLAGHAPGPAQPYAGAMSA